MQEEEEDDVLSPQEMGQRRNRADEDDDAPVAARAVRAGYYDNGRRKCVKRWVFTAYQPPWNISGLPLEALPRNVAYVCGQPEYNTTQVQGPNGVAQRRTHFQGFVEMSDKATLEEVANALGLEAKGNWFEPSRAVCAAKPIEYTKKMESAVLNDQGESQWRELGQITTKHVTEQYRELIDMATQKGATFQQLLEANPSMVVNHHAAVERVLRVYQKPEDRSHCQVFFFYGDTGVGKTHSIRNLESDFVNSVYVKLSGSKFWDGYEGQKVIVFDDLRDDEYKPQEMLRYLQKFAMSVEIKGSTRPACWTKVYVTSNVPLEQWYYGADAKTREAFMARFPRENRITFHARVTKPYSTVAQLRLLQAQAYADQMLAEVEAQKQ
jgi:hypothetical protein